jgi:hypothetical protein
VDQRVERTGCQAEGCHQFSGAGEGPPVFGFEHPQNGRHKGPGMTDADPEHKGDNEHTPVNGTVQAGNPHSGADHVPPAAEQQQHDPGAQSGRPQPEFPGCGGHHFHHHAVHLLARAGIEHQMVVRIFLFFLGGFKAAQYLGFSRHCVHLP